MPNAAQNGAAFKIKTAQQKFEEEYTAAVVPADNKDGFKIRYYYYGLWYIWNLPEKALKKRKAIILVECIASVLLYFIAFIVRAPINSLALVAIPILIGLCGFVLEICGVCQFGFARYKTTKSNFKQADGRIKNASAFVFLCCIFAALAGAYYMVVYSGFIAINLIAVIGYMGIAVLSFFIREQYKDIPFRTEKNDILDHIEVFKMDATE